MKSKVPRPSHVLLMGLRVAVFIICTGLLVLPYLWSDRSSPAFVIDLLSILLGVLMLIIIAVLIRRPVIRDGGKEE